MGEATTLLQELQTALLGMVLDPTSRVFWPFLISALVLAAVSGAGLRQGLLRPSLWLRRGTGLDLALLSINVVIRVAGASVVVFSAFGLAVTTVSALGRFAPVGALDWSAGVVSVVYTLALFVAWDASRFLLHVAMHRVPALWALHQVHHSATVLTPLTLFRVHPLESALYRLRGILVTGVVTGVFFWIFGRSAVEVSFLGVNALGFVFNAFGGNLRHSHAYWSWGLLERLAISPAQHQLHHALDAPASAVNLGTWLSVWDRLLGTWRSSAGRKTEAFGLREATLNHDPERLGSLLLDPLKASVGAAVPVPEPASTPRPEQHQPA